MKGVFFIMLKKEMAIDAKIKAVETKKNDFIESILPNKLKSKYLTCSCCGSKIRKDLFQGFKCPACKSFICNLFLQLKHNPNEAQFVVRKQSRVRIYKLKLSQAFFFAQPAGKN